MAARQLINRPCGQLVPTGKGQLAFIPDPLPRQLDLSSSLVYRLDEASRAVATLSGVGEIIPNPHLLIRPFVRREAVLSSRIEGTQASLSELFLYEASGERHATGDVIEVANYVRALDHGMELLERLPISARLMNELHLVLMRSVRGADKRPGELRTDQVWIGPSGTPIEEARFIPPPPSYVRDQLEDLERFVNERGEMPPLIQCALMHYQFEAIHPYLDGNGRIGRLLITLFLCERKVLSIPMLYLSAYFERDRDKYYDRLHDVSETGNWDSWLDYFLEGVAEQALDALQRTRHVRALQEKYRWVLQERRVSSNALRLADQLFARPYMTTRLAAILLDVTYAGAKGILERLAQAGVIEEIPNQWPRLYVARELLNVIDEPTVAR